MNLHTNFASAVGPLRAFFQPEQLVPFPATRINLGDAVGIEVPQCGPVLERQHLRAFAAATRGGVLYAKPEQPSADKKPLRPDAIDLAEVALGCALGLGLAIIGKVLVLAAALAFCGCVAVALLAV